MHRALSSSRLSLSGPIQNKKVTIILLSGEELRLVTDSKAKVQHVFDQVCQHLGLRETRYFGLAIRNDGEFWFLDLTNKISKYAPKSWRGKKGDGCDGVGRPLLKLYFRVQYYIYHRLIREKVTRHLYYQQLLENVLNYQQLASEEKCFQIAAYALQANLGNYTPTKHKGQYFQPKKYLPTWILAERKEKYILSNLLQLHKELRGTTKVQAALNFIREASTPPSSHSMLLYRLKKKKAERKPSLWIGICPDGLEIFEDAALGFKNELSVFEWGAIGRLQYNKKKFEIQMEHPPHGRKFTYYTTSHDYSGHLLWLCQKTHAIQMSLQSVISESRRLDDEERKHYRESYIYSDDVDLAWEMQHDRSNGPEIDKRISLISKTSSVTTSGIASEKMQASLDSDNGEDGLSIKCPASETTVGLSESSGTSSLSRQLGSLSLEKNFQEEVADAEVIDPAGEGEEPLKSNMEDLQNAPSIELSPTAVQEVAVSSDNEKLSSQLAKDEVENTMGLFDVVSQGGDVCIPSPCLNTNANSCDSLSGPKSVSCEVIRSNGGTSVFHSASVSQTSSGSQAPSLKSMSRQTSVEASSSHVFPVQPKLPQAARSYDSLLQTTITVPQYETNSCVYNGPNGFVEYGMPQDNYVYFTNELNNDYSYVDIDGLASSLPDPNTGQFNKFPHEPGSQAPQLVGTPFSIQADCVHSSVAVSQSISAKPTVMDEQHQLLKEGNHRKVHQIVGTPFMIQSEPVHSSLAVSQSTGHRMQAQPICPQKIATSGSYVPQDLGVHCNYKTGGVNNLGVSHEFNGPVGFHSESFQAQPPVVRRHPDYLRHYVNEEMFDDASHQKKRLSTGDLMFSQVPQLQQTLSKSTEELSSKKQKSVTKAYSFGDEKLHPDLENLRGVSNTVSLPLITALCNDRTLLDMRREKSREITPDTPHKDSVIESIMNEEAEIPKPDGLEQNHISVCSLDTEYSQDTMVSLSSSVPQTSSDDVSMTSILSGPFVSKDNNLIAHHSDKPEILCAHNQNGPLITIP